MPGGINALSENLLSFFPLPNNGANVFTSTQVVRQDANQYGVRLDHYLTTSDILNFRYAISDGSQFNPIPTSGASVPGFPVGQEQRAQNFVAQETHTFSPAMIGVFRFSFLRNKFLYGERTNHTTPGSLGFQYDPSLDVAVGPPFIQVNGYTTIGDPITGPRNTYENAYDYSASLSWVRGRHELKFGGGYQHLHVNVLQGIATNGFFVFVPFPVVPDAFATFLFGQPIFFLQGRGDFSRGINGQSFNSYVQDTYKVSSRLTVNLGLRYELPSPYTEIKNRQTLFIPGRQSTVVPSAPLGILYPGRQGRSRWPDPNLQEGICAPRRLCLGPDRKLQVAGDLRVRNLLRTLLHRSGRTVAIADQRASLSTDSAAQQSSAQFCQSLLSSSVQRQPSTQRPVCNSADQFDGCGEPPLALRAGLGLEHSTILRLRPAV